MNPVVWLLLMQLSAVPAPHPFGMHIQAGSTGALVKVAPDLYAGCAPHGRACLDSDARPAGSKGVVQPDLPVYDTRGWYWVKIRWDTGLIGWSSDLSPYIEAISPPTMNFGVPFVVGGNYGPGAPLTVGDCIADGLKIANATLQFSTAPPFIDKEGVSWPQVQGLMKCPWGANVSAGNHIAVIIARNVHPTTGVAQSAPSAEFQFVVAQTGTTLSPPPAQPANARVIYSLVPVNPTMVVTPTR